jgi:ABC-type bacteriocin/lantibiotic exporter with double-glycine peptidase domain
MKKITPQQLTKWMKQKGVCRMKLGKLLGVTPETISNWKARNVISLKGQIKLEGIMARYGKSTK